MMSLKLGSQVMRVHFVGIGGIGMSGIARMLLTDSNFEVTGSENRESVIVDDLRLLGAVINIGHQAENVAGADKVVRTSAVSDSNPEIVEAKRLNIPIVHRSDMLAELFNAKAGVSVAGTHGKTTTSSLCVVMLTECAMDPSYIVGGIIENYGSNAGVGKSELTVIEADESDGTLVKYRPQVAIITNVEMDHADYYGSLADVMEVFKVHISKIKDDGAVVWCADCENLKSLMQTVELQNVESISYGFDATARLCAENVEMCGAGSCFDVTFDGVTLGHISLPLLGKHNVYNALGVIGAGLKLGLSLDKMRQGLMKFCGAKRRFHVLARHDDGMPKVVDDYAHHPTEVKATLDAAHCVAAGKRRIVVAFQPHRFSRTKAFAKDFASALCSADRVILAPVYSAGEEPIHGATSETIATALRMLAGSVDIFEASSLADVESVLKEEMGSGDAMILALGAGDIWKVAHNLAR